MASFLKTLPGDIVLIGGFWLCITLTWTEDVRVIEYVKQFAETFPLAGGGALTASKFLELFLPERLEFYTASYRQGGCRYGEMKQELSRAIYEELRPIQEKRREIEASAGYVEKVMKEGAEKARETAQATIEEVKQKMGLLV